MMYMPIKYRNNYFLNEPGCKFVIIAALFFGVNCQIERDVSTVDYISVSGLCKRNVSEESCSHQESPFLKDEACLVYALSKDSIRCSDESFIGDNDKQKQWSNFSMSTYLYRSKGVHTIPCFNVSFSNIKWVNMKMRFKELDPPRVALCREFKILPDLMNKLFFDCLWDRGGYQSKPFTFEYQIKTQSGNTYLYKYLFKVPNSDHMWSHGSYDEVNINDFKVFSMVDLSNQASQLSLIVEALPPSLNVTVYKIKMTYVATDMSSNKTVEFNKVHNPLIPSFTYFYNQKLYPGSYVFSITFEHPQCVKSCSISTTPVVYFRDTEKNTFKIILGALILTSLCIITYFLVKIKSKKSCSVPGMNPPKVLLVYNPVSEKHLKTMKSLANFLKNDCHLDVMIDILDMEHQAPLEWYITAFNRANFVCVFMSPKSDSFELENVTKSIIFHNSYSMAIMQLEHAQYTSKCKFFSIALPDTSFNTLPFVARRFKSFKLPQELNSLLKTMKVKPEGNLIRKLKKILENYNVELNRAPIIIECVPKVTFEDKVSPATSRSASPTNSINQCFHCKQSDVFNCEDEPLNPTNNPPSISSRSSSPDCFT